MAFVARRSSDGKVVDRQQVSGGGVSHPLALSDISDEESPDSVLAYTSRTYGAPTVRFRGQGDGDDGEGDVEGELEEDNLDMAALDIGADDSDSDSITNFCNQLDEEEANEAMHMLKFEERLGVSEHSEEFEDLCDLDEDDMTDERSVMDKPEDAAATDTETVMNTDPDLRSLCSFESFTPTLTLRDEDNTNLDNISDKTSFKEDDQDTMSEKSFTMEDKQDELSPTTVLKEDNLDNLSTRTYNKQPFTPKRGRQREPDLDQLSSRTYDLNTCDGSLRSSLRSGGPGQHDNSSISTCSWTDMYRGAVQPSDGHSAIVPSLSLASSASDTSTYYKSLAENKERHSQAAFDDWKARKAQQKQKSLLAAKQEREKREAEAALRQQLAQARFQEWCRRKEEQQQQERKKPFNLRPSVSSGNSSGSISSSGSGSGLGSGSGSGSGSVSGPVSGPGAARKAASEATKKRLKEWHVVKTKQQQREKEQKRRLEENKRKLEEERKQRAQGAWKNWMKQVDKRAKPVPLNQGFDTLRGTISNIYINPVQWVSNIEPKESGRSR